MVGGWVRGRVRGRGRGRVGLGVRVPRAPCTIRFSSICAEAMPK